MKQYLVPLISAVLFISCASSLPYATDYPLSQQTLRSRDGIFTAKVPQGWYSSTGDTLLPAVVAWLIKDDLSAAMGVRQLNLDRQAGIRVEKEGLELLAHISAGLRQGGSDSPAVVVAPKEFETQQKKFCSYEIAAGGKRTRIVVFSARGRYYECEAIGMKGSGSSDETARMFTAQQTFLASLTF